MDDTGDVSDRRVCQKVEMEERLPLVLFATTIAITARVADVARTIRSGICGVKVDRTKRFDPLTFCRAS